MRRDGVGTEAVARAQGSVRRLERDEVFFAGDSQGGSSNGGNASPGSWHRHTRYNPVFFHFDFWGLFVPMEYRSCFLRFRA